MDGQPDRESVGSVGRAAAKAVPWLVATNIASKLFSFGAQLVLGIVLLPHDFGVYAIVAAITVFTKAIQDGGVYEYLIQRGRDRFAKDSVDALWLVVMLNAGSGVVLAALANPISRAYGEPEVAQLLYVVAASIPLTSVWVVTSARLILEFQFGRYAMVSLAATAVQYGGIVLFALLGYGALSFVIPLPLVAVTSSLGGWLATRQRLWRRPTVRTWGRMIDSGRWLVAAALAAALFTQGDYLAIGAIVSSTTLGIYYFAFQIPAQLGVFASTLSGVLLSALSRLGTVEEQGKALARTLRALMLLLCGTSMLIATIYPALEKIVWGTKWESSITPVIVLALLMPFRLLYVIGKTAYLTAARFRTWSLIVTAEAVGLVTTAALTAAVNPTPTGLALGVGLYLSVSVLWIVMRGVRAYGISSPHLIRLILPVWLYSISAFLAAAAPMQFADLPDGSVLVLALQASTYVVVAALLFRTFAADALRDCLAILPAAARRRALKWLRLTLPTESPTFPL